MGTWGTALKDSDPFADLYAEFFDHYNKGGHTDSISKKIVEDNWAILEIEEGKYSLWFALGLAQWETKSRNPKVLSTIEEIIASGADLKIWLDLRRGDKEILNFLFAKSALVLPDKLVSSTSVTLFSSSYGLTVFNNFHTKPAP